MRKIIYLFFLFSIFTLPTTAQTRRNKKKPLPVKAVVTIKIDKAPEIKLPSEESQGIWNEYTSAKYNFNITFPAKSEDVRDDEMDKFVTFEASTQKASYGLMVKSLSASLSNSQLDEVYETSFRDILVGGDVKLISKKNVYLNRRLGREFVFADKKKIYFQRIYILEGRLYFLSVMLPKKEYTADFDKWALKFFESFSVEEKDKLFG
jgi:hypothetical protein